VLLNLSVIRKRTAVTVVSLLAVILASHSVRRVYVAKAIRNQEASLAIVAKHFLLVPHPMKLKPIV